MTSSRLDLSRTEDTVKTLIHALNREMKIISSAREKVSGFEGRISSAQTSQSSNAQYNVGLSQSIKSQLSHARQTMTSAVAKVGAIKRQLSEIQNKLYWHLNNWGRNLVDLRGDQAKVKKMLPTLSAGYQKAQDDSQGELGRLVTLSDDIKAALNSSQQAISAFEDSVGIGGADSIDKIATDNTVTTDFTAQKNYGPTTVTDTTVSILDADRYGQLNNYAAEYPKPNLNQGSPRAGSLSDKIEMGSGTLETPSNHNCQVSMPNFFYPLAGKYYSP